MDDRWKVLAATHLLAFGVGWGLAPRQRLDEEIAYTGLASTETRRTIAAAVLSLRREDRLLVYTYRGAAHVQIEQSELLGLFESSADLVVPASVSFLVDLGELNENDVRWDAAAKVVTVSLSPLVLGEVALEPERATLRTAGLLTLSDRRVQSLARSGFMRARSTLIVQAQEQTIWGAAEGQARANVERHFSLALGAAGHRNVRVVATFGGRRGAPKT